MYSLVSISSLTGICWPLTSGEKGRGKDWEKGAWKGDEEARGGGGKVAENFEGGVVV